LIIIHANNCFGREMCRVVAAVPSVDPVEIRSFASGSGKRYQIWANYKLKDISMNWKLSCKTVFFCSVEQIGFSQCWSWNGFENGINYHLKWLWNLDWARLFCDQIVETNRFLGLFIFNMHFPNDREPDWRPQMTMKTKLRTIIVLRWQALTYSRLVSWSPRPQISVLLIFIY